MKQFWNVVSPMDTSLNKFYVLSFSALTLTVLGACDMYRETYVTPNRIQIEQSVFNEARALEQVNDGYLDSVAEEYNRTGTGPVTVSVSYDPFAKANNATKARVEAEKIAHELGTRGVGGVNAVILPVSGSGAVSDVSLSFVTYNALPPKDCTLMDGIETRRAESDPNYKLGCSVDAMLVQQVARPKDLAGRAGDDTTSDGRRAANMVEIYRGGIGNKPLEGESASD